MEMTLEPRGTYQVSKCLSTTPQDNPKGLKEDPNVDQRNYRAAKMWNQGRVVPTKLDGKILPCDVGTT